MRTDLLFLLTKGLGGDKKRQPLTQQEMASLPDNQKKQDEPKPERIRSPATQVDGCGKASQL